MGKKDNPLLELQNYKHLIEKADILLGKKKLPPKKKCKSEGCSKNAEIAGHCKEHYWDGRKQREAIKIGKKWKSTNGLWYTYNDEMKPQLLHRYVLEKKLERKLDRNEKVIWKDGDKNNNSEENLILESDLLATVCPHCGEKLI